VPLSTTMDCAVSADGCVCSPVFLGLDVGTQSVKALLYTTTEGEHARVLAVGNSRPIPIDDIGGGYIEQNPADWILAVRESIAAVFHGRWEYLSQLVAIGVSGQQHGLVMLDCNNAVVRPCMLWCDTRADKEAAEMTGLDTDNYIPAGFTGPKILWLKNNELENYNRTAKIMLPHDYINYYLSGMEVHSMERGDASGMGLLHKNGQSFNSALLSHIDSDLHSKLPTSLADPNKMIGKLDRNIAISLFSGHYDINSSDILLSPGSGDNAMSALGVGASMPDSSALVVSLGTSGTIATCSSTRLSDPSGIVAPFCDASGHWLPLTCIQNCGLVLEEIRTSFGHKVADESDPGPSEDTIINSNTLYSADEITELAVLEPIGCEGVIVIPYFSSAGERTPDWPHASGGILGMHAGHCKRPGLMYRAAIESVAFSLYRGYKQMQAIGLATSSQELQVVGGGARNKLWCQVC
jgi:xylulokinase